MQTKLLAGWSLYHKVTYGFVFLLVALIVVKGVTAIEGGAYKVEKTRHIEAPADVVWHWITDPELRTRWEAHIVDTIRQKGDPAIPGSTRRLFWRDQGKRWNGLERTSDLIPGERYQSYEESDQDTRSRMIELAEDPGACVTTVRFVEIIRHETYQFRFFSFFRQQRAADRLAVSLDALQRWMTEIDACGGKGPA